MSTHTPFPARPSQPQHTPFSPFVYVCYISKTASNPHVHQHVTCTTRRGQSQPPGIGVLNASSYIEIESFWKPRGGTNKQTHSHIRAIWRLNRRAYCAGTVCDQEALNKAVWIFLLKDITFKDLLVYYCIRKIIWFVDFVILYLGSFN